MKKNVKIIIAEKHSMASNIEKHINCPIKKNGYVQNKDGSIIISRAVGHLLVLQKPPEIDNKYQLWNMDNLPIFIDFKGKYKVTESDTANQLKNIMNIFRNNKNNEIEFYHAGDPDREGELILRNISNYIKKTLKEEGENPDEIIKHEYRMWLKDFSKKTVLSEFEKKLDIKHYNNLYMSSVARAHSDWLVGFNLTPYYTLISGSYKDYLSVGRVQSAILKIVVDKEMEIRNFKEIITYKVLGKFSEENPFIADWFSNNLKDGKLVSMNQVNQVLEDLKKRKEFEVIEKKKTEKKEELKELYNLVNLQQDAEKKYGFQPTDTLKFMQNLYEKYKIMSYPRANDSGYIAEDDYVKLEEALLQGLSNVSEYKEIIELFLKEGKIKKQKNYVDNDKVGGHSGIYILNTEDAPFEKVYNELPKQEKNILRLIINRILGVLEGQYIYESSELILNNGPHFFKIRGKIVKDLGWKKYYNLSDNKNKNGDKVLPNLEKGSKVNLISAEHKEVKNKKPQRYTKGTLGLSIDDLAVLLKENKELSAKIRKISPKTAKGDRKLGLGTGGTRGNIIDGLEKDKYIFVKNNKIEATNKGIKLISIIDNLFGDPITTGQWEYELKKIEDGESTYNKFIEGLKKDISSVIERKNIIADKKYNYQPVLEDSIGVCPKCGVGEMFFWEKGCSCSASNCNFILWYNFLEHTFSKKEIKDLLNGKILENIEMYSKKKNKNFTSNLIFDKKQSKIIFTNEKNKK